MTSQTTEDEIQQVAWRSIAGYEGRYEVSDDGSVRSLARPRARPRVLAQIESDGYLRVSLQRGFRKRRMFLVHRLVLAAFRGPCPQGREAAHLDGNRKNNRIANLEWTSRIENHSHKILHGTAPRAEKAPSAKLTWSDVDQIRELRSLRTQVEIAAAFGINRTTVQRIQSGATWKPEYRN